MPDLTQILERREHALKIWRAGVAEIDSRHLVAKNVVLKNDELILMGQKFPLDQFQKLIVVGGGKAGQGMVDGLEDQLGSEFLRERVQGWVNVPEDCVDEERNDTSTSIHIHAARPAGVNEPRLAGVEGTQKILELVANADANDLVVVLLSGGGSALLPAPVDAISLEDKLFVTRKLSRHGATIEELNLVRRHLSKIKGGGLSKACNAGTMITMIISDVIGDPLETIASGPTVTSEHNPGQALSILQKYLASEFPESIRLYLSDTKNSSHNEQVSVHVINKIVGSNAIALNASEQRAINLGYDVINAGAFNEGEAQLFAQQIIRQALEESGKISKPVCLLYGGETTVSLKGVSNPGKGGRNQEVALAVIHELKKHPELVNRFVLIAGGTDGEDGPTDAAGGFADLTVIHEADRLNLPPSDFLARHDAYHFLDACNALLKTGPTHTNVMDITIAMVWPV
ncbi:glycerate kinase type-2 family protein [Rubinisphaera italica]|uniref:Putative hydroxypyruvate reductase n=1 Tax=Rubinisphaera italica TaxID=2527969 RepID=A0A5C5XC45_9PLAN|nr:DUF4147 domain-containing protein [Rubinisphaera italica]TWT60358.1 putative hydroxypyruvate reductase [Rubinisphaera italica]